MSLFSSPGPRFCLPLYSDGFQGRVTRSHRVVVQNPVFSSLLGIPRFAANQAIWRLSVARDLVLQHSGWVFSKYPFTYVRDDFLPLYHWGFHLKANKQKSGVSNLVLVALCAGSIGGSGWSHACFSQKDSVKLNGISPVAGSPERGSSGFFHQNQVEFLIWYLTFKHLPWFEWFI